MGDRLGLDSIDTLRIVHDPLLLSKSLAVLLLLGQRSPHGSGPLGTEVQWLVLPASKQLPQVSALVVVDDRQHSSNGLANHLTVSVEGGRVCGKNKEVQMGEYVSTQTLVIHQWAVH